MSKSKYDGVNISSFSTDDGEFMVASFPLEAPGLTDDERELIDLVARGLSDEEIAVRHGTDASVISERVAILCRRLKVASRRELAAALDGGEDVHSTQ